jgi:hypothetical protein
MSFAGRAKMLPLRDVQAFESQKMINQIHFWRGLDWPKRDGATFGFQHGKGTAVAETALVPNVLRDHNLPFLRHTHDSHGWKLLLAVAGCKSELNVGNHSSRFWGTIQVKK